MDNKDREIGLRVRSIYNSHKGKFGTIIGFSRLNRDTLVLYDEEIGCSDGLSWRNRLNKPNYNNMSPFPTESELRKHTFINYSNEIIVADVNHPSYFWSEVRRSASNNFRREKPSNSGTRGILKTTNT